MNLLPKFKVHYVRAEVQHVNQLAETPNYDYVAGLNESRLVILAKMFDYSNHSEETKECDYKHQIQHKEQSNYYIYLLLLCY